MALATGKRFGAYDVQSVIGAGGMGEVYRARDPRLHRDVALKILPDQLANDPDRLARFQREAQVLASVNHPNVAAIYGLEEHDGVGALVLELVDGPTLAERIARGPLAINEALRIARSITDGLEAAHQKGIVHRDLKPANIKITPDGQVKVLDFGLAKAGDEQPADVSRSPTVMATVPGVIMGTAPYMAPEQATGKDADRSSDVWAFGCVLYEMLTGRRTFPGETVSETLAEILKGEPDWSALPAQTPEAVRRLLRRCLQKDRSQRLHDIGDARLELDDALAPDDQHRPAGLVSRHERWVWAAALTMAVSSVAAVSMWTWRRPEPPETHVEITAPFWRYTRIAISPDGQKIVFTSDVEGRRLWLRALNSAVAQPLSGTDGGLNPFWSPDGRSIGFWAAQRIKRLDLESGSVRTIAEGCPVPLGGTWSRDGLIVFSPNPGAPMMRVSDEGGERAPVSRFEAQHQSHSFPVFLPDQRHFLFFVEGAAETRGVHVGRIDAIETRRLFEASGPAVYAPTGHLLFVRDGKLIAQRFDVDRMQPRGEPFSVAEAASGETRVGATALDASPAGPIGYRTPSADSGQRELVWVDRSGNELERAVYADVQSQGPALSSDGRRIAVFRSISGNTDIWIYETSRRTWDRVTFDAGDDIFPLWSPDASRIAFASRRGRMDLYWTTLSGGSGREELLLTSPDLKLPMDWSRDGQLLLFNIVAPGKGADIWALPLHGERVPFAVIDSAANERLPQLSPDTKWMAYESDKTGRFEIYVRPFRGSAADVPVSVNGGTQVRWNPNGRELFYIAPDDRLMSVTVSFPPRGDAIELGPPVPLFGTQVGARAINTNRQQYMVSPDGQSFVMNSMPEEATPSPLRLILNWKPQR